MATQNLDMTKHAQIVIPSTEQAINKNNGILYSRGACSNYAFNTICGNHIYHISVVLCVESLISHSKNLNEHRICKQQD